MKIASFLLLFSCFQLVYGQNVGLGTSTPNSSALLHVDVGSNVSKGFIVTGAVGGSGAAVPDIGAGSRMFYFPGKAAFRAGHVSGTHWNNVNVGYGSLANGNNTIASGSYSSAFGYVTTASAVSATAMGYYSVANGAYSTAIGAYTVAKSPACVSVGALNDDTDNPDPNNPNYDDRIFQIGNGSGVTRKNAMTVLLNGNVGIGTTTPGNALSFPAILGKKISLYPGATGDVGFAVFGNQLQIYSDHSGASVKIGYDNNGSFVNNLEIYGNGNAWLRGTLTQNSDARLKTNITPITNALSIITSLQGYRYNWIDENIDGNKQVGVLAQELMQVLPELVKENENGVLRVNYIGIVPVLINAIKEQHILIDEKEQQILQLQKQSEDLRVRLERLEKKLY